MKRNLDLIRTLLLHFEAKSDHAAEKATHIEGYDELTVKYHVLLLAQAKLIDYEPELTTTGRIIRAIPFGLSWHGHEFLDSVRNDKVWEQVKDRARREGTEMPFEIVKSLALDIVKKLIGL